VLFQLDNQFTNFVKAYRPGLSKRAILGADMTAEDAMKEGLLDDIATFDEAIQLVKSLANSYQPKVKTKTKMSKQYVIITSNKALLASARTLQNFNASNISIEEVDEENDDNGNPTTNEPEGAGASASNQQQQTGQPAASNAASTTPPATANAQPDASAQSQEKIRCGTCQCLSSITG
jgi:ClpP class serine protease